MKVTFTTEEYKFNHGKEPRGFGRWMAEVDGKDVIEFTGTISQLRAHINQVYKDKGQKTPIRAKILS